MADESPTRPTTSYGKPPGRGDGAATTLPINVVAVVLSSVLAGGGGSYLTGSSVSTEMREGMIRMEGRLDALREEVRRVAEDQRAALGRMETRAAAMEQRLGILEREVWTRAAAAQGGPR